MGLDSYYFGIITLNGVKRKIALQNPTPEHMNTWRKYDSLHDWVESLWIAAGCPGAVSSSGDTDPKVVAYGDSYTIIIPTASSEPVFNQTPFPLPASTLEAWFRSQDADFDTPNSVDYKNITDDDSELTDAQFYRNWNKQILQMAASMEKKGFTLYYDSWW